MRKLAQRGGVTYLRALSTSLQGNQPTDSYQSLPLSGLQGWTGLAGAQTRIRAGGRGSGGWGMGYRYVGL